MKLKKLYSSREVAAITGLTARQLQWWDRRGIFAAAIPTERTARGGFTERRYTPIELLELMVLADFAAAGSPSSRLRRLMRVLAARFQVRSYEAIEGGGPITLFIDGDQIYARTTRRCPLQRARTPRAALLDRRPGAQAARAHRARRGRAEKEAGRTLRFHPSGSRSAPCGSGYRGR